MGALVATSAPCAKGAICHSLDECSRGDGARARLEGLRGALAQASSYADLAELFDRHLLSHVITDATQRQRAVDHLRRFWLDPNSTTPFFPAVPVGQLLAEGVRKTIELSLGGKGDVVPINSWWLLDAPEFRVVNVADVAHGATVSHHVTLLIMTPRPAGQAQAPAIMGDVAEAYVTEHRGGRVATRRVRDA